MKNIHRSLSALAALSLIAVGCQNTDSPISSDQGTTDQAKITMAENGKGIAGQYIVVFNDDVQDAEMPKLASKTAQLSASSIQKVYSSAFKGFLAKMTLEQAQQLAKDPTVKFVEQDQIATISDGGTQQTNPQIAAQTIPWGIQRMGGAGDGTGRVAWIVDTGIDLFHADLNVDRTLSRNFVYGESSPQDGNGHGTHVAGIIGAKNDANGVVGIAANARLVAVRVLNNNGQGSYSDIIAGIDYVTSRASAGQVANLSLGGGASSALDYAVTRLANKGVRVVIAAGNSSANSAYSSPARVNHSNVYTVSAMDVNNYFASFSNYGNPPIDCAAPGVNIQSSWPGGGTATLSGTSMAAPHVAGAILMGTLRGDGYVIGDPDGRADIIAHR